MSICTSIEENSWSKCDVWFRSDNPNCCRSAMDHMGNGCFGYVQFQVPLKCWCFPSGKKKLQISKNWIQSTLRHLHQTQHTSASVLTKRPAMPRIITVLHCPPGRTSKPKKMDLKTLSKCSSDLGVEVKTTARSSLLHWKAKWIAKQSFWGWYDETWLYKLMDLDRFRASLGRRSSLMMHNHVTPQRMQAFSHQELFSHLCR